VHLDLTLGPPPRRSACTQTTHLFLTSDIMILADFVPSLAAVMAFTNGLSERMGELRFPNPKSPNEDVPYSGYVSPPRGQNPFFSPFQPSASDGRGSLQRRFTTDSSKMSSLSLSSMGGQNPQLVKSQFTASVRSARFILSMPISMSNQHRICVFCRCAVVLERYPFWLRPP
jgi:hypothetical protein